MRSGKLIIWKFGIVEIRIPKIRTTHTGKLGLSKVRNSKDDSTLESLFQSDVTLLSISSVLVL